MLFLKRLKSIFLTNKLIPHELFFIQTFRKEGKLISVQNPAENNPLIQLALDPSHEHPQPLENPVRQHSPHSEHSSPPDSPASQQLQQVCAISIFPSLQLISLPTQHLLKQPYILYLIPVTKDPVPLNTTSPQNGTTTKLTQTPDHTNPSYTAPISNSLPTIKTLYTYTPISVYTT